MLHVHVCRHGCDHGLVEASVVYSAWSLYKLLASIPLLDILMQHKIH